MTHVLRDYQEHMVAGARAQIQNGRRRVLIQAPTGAGKTVVAAAIVAGVVRRGGTAWFVVHRRELLEQAHTSLKSLGLRTGRIASGSPRDRLADVQVCSIQTLARIEDLEDPTLIVVDEAHHATSKSWRDQIMDRKSFVVGLSATPTRLDGRGLDKVFEALVPGPQVSDLIELGSLSNYRIFAPSSVDMSGAKSSGGDWSRSESAERSRSITGCAVESYLSRSRGRAIAYCCNIEHSKETAQKFMSSGVTAAHVDGETPASIRDDIVEKFRAGAIKVLCNCELFCEGFDVPDADCAILLRPTQSLTLYLQQVGRVLRPSGGKVAVILDHVGNVERHGLPCDYREWDLASGVVRRPSEYEVPCSVCPFCFAAQSPGKTCKFCGCPMSEPKKRKSPEQIAGELVELEFARVSRDVERKSARNFDELVAVGRSRGYKNPIAWASHVMRGRKR